MNIDSIQNNNITVVFSDSEIVNVIVSDIIQVNVAISDTENAYATISPVTVTVLI